MPDCEPHRMKIKVWHCRRFRFSRTFFLILKSLNHQNMELLEHFRRQFTYDAWANREVLANLKTSSRSTARPLQLLSHILSAEQLWLERIRERPQTLPVWPEFNFDQCEMQIDECARLWLDLLAQLDSAALSKNVAYKNSKGEPWSSTIQDILTHVLLHSAYHRGQIASHIRANGEQPAYTDFILAVRRGLIE
jgi:uncharacterized damage-inducible protein DinB